jgi:hypothetical protein
MRRLCALYLILPVIAALTSAACSDDLTTTPTEPTPTTVTETFSGTVPPNGASSHNFSTGGSGSVTATIKTLAPDSQVTIGLALGTWNGASCQIVIARDNAVQGNNVIGQVTSAGLLCVRLYDVGGLAEPTSYDVEVVHP